MTRREAMYEFGMTPRMASYALTLLDSTTSVAAFLGAFMHRFRTTHRTACEAYDFAKWANEPDNIHIFY